MTTSKADYGIEKITYWWSRLRGFGMTDREIARRVLDRIGPKTDQPGDETQPDDSRLLIVGKLLR